MNPFKQLPTQAVCLARAVAVGAVVFSGLSCGGASDSTGPRNLPSLSALALLDDSVAFTPGDSLYAAYSATRSDGTAATYSDVHWDTRNKAVVDVVAPGRIHGTGAGRTWIVASNGALADSMLVIVRAQLAVRLSSHLDTVTSLGDSLPLSASFPDAPGARVPVTWGSRDSTIARVTQDGIVIGVTEGSTNVLALEDGGGRDSDLVVVRQRLERIDVQPPIDSLHRYRTAHLVARAVDARGATIARLPLTWESTDTSLAIVDDTGLVTARMLGLDTLRASVPGLTRNLPLVVAPPIPLRFNLDTIFLGVGQYPSFYGPPRPRILADQHGTEESFPIHFAFADTAIATIGPAVFPEDWGRDSSSLVLPTGRRVGTTVMTATAAGYGPGTVVVRVTKPKLVMPDSALSVLDPAHPQATTIFADFQDSLGHDTQLGVPLPILYRSSDTAVVVPSVAQALVDSGRVNISVAMRPVGAGTAWLVLEPDGYTRDSTFVRVSTFQPKIHFVREPLAVNLIRDAPLYVGVGQTTTYFEVGVQQPAIWGVDSVHITLSHGHGGVIQTPDSADRHQGYFHVIGLTQGRDTIVATAPGCIPDSLIVVVVRPSFSFSFDPTLNPVTFPSTTVFRGVAAGVTYSDSTRSERHDPVSSPFVARLTSTDTTVLRPEADTIVFNDISNTPTAAIIAVGPGTARLVVSDPAGEAIPDTSLAIAVVAAPIHLHYAAGYQSTSPYVTVGFHQTLTDSERIYIDTPDYTDPAVISLRSTNAAVVQPSASSIHGVKYGYDAGSFSVIGGEQAGTAWIVADGPGIIPDSLPVIAGRPQLQVIRVVELGQSQIDIALRLTDQTGRPRRSIDPLTFDLWSTNAAVLSVDSTTLSVPAMSGITTGKTTLHFAGAGTAAIRVSDPRAVPYAYLPGATRLIEVDALHHPVTQIFPDSLTFRWR